MKWILLIPFLLFANDPYIIFLVEARKLDVSSNSSLIRSIAKHPSDGSKNSDVGHAWIYFYDGEQVIEGGHSGETGLLQPRYLDGVFHLAEQNDPNPIRYLYTSQKDGYFEVGSGGHQPTLAAYMPLTLEQAQSIKNLICSYPFQNYSIAGRSCCHFIEAILFLLGHSVDASETITINPILCGKKVWTDPVYSTLTFGSPDRLQKELRKLIHNGDAQEVHFKTHRCLRKTLYDLKMFPERSLRYLWVLLNS